MREGEPLGGGTRDTPSLSHKMSNGKQSVRIRSPPMMNRERIVKKGNTKLGKGIGKIALPAVQTCPGRGECEQFCYAAKLMMRFPDYNDSIQGHLQVLEDNPSLYEESVIDDIEHGKYKVVRIHESGDFYSVEQIKMWKRIAQALPNVEFYGYTRSWTVPSLKTHIEDLYSLSNVSIRASVEEGEVPPAGWAYTTVVDKNHSSRPKGGIICHEQTGKKATCADCGVCWKSDALVLFLKH